MNVFRPQAHGINNKRQQLSVMVDSKVEKNSTSNNQARDEMLASAAEIVNERDAEIAQVATLWETITKQSASAE